MSPRCGVAWPRDLSPRMPSAMALHKSERAAHSPGLSSTFWLPRMTENLVSGIRGDAGRSPSARRALLTPLSSGMAAVLLRGGRAGGML